MKQQVKNHFTKFVKIESDCDFMPWECLSFMRKNWTTLDFVVKSREDLMILKSVATAIIYGQEAHKETMISFRKMAFKMKVSYQCWQR